MIERDLLGHPIPRPATPRRPRDAVRRLGYASRPGTGPKGQRCSTCKSCIVMMRDEVRVRRCEIVAAKWTDGVEFDIKHNAPACRDWQRKRYDNERN